jgi:23S rRNA-intervening sequence protein
MGIGAEPRKNLGKPSSELPVVVQKAYEFSLWLIQKVENFPRSYRFSVGDRLVQSVLDLLLRLVDAAYSRDKSAILNEVNGLLNRMRFLLRLAKDLKLLLVDSYGFAAESVEEIGRMAGGWRKASVRAE